MVARSDDHQDGLLSAIGSFTWLVVATLLAAAAGYAAYYKLGGLDTGVQKAGVVGAALLGLGVAVWLNKIARLGLYAAIIVLALWGANYLYFHK